jgi:predicted HD phosphohydrolase
MAMLQSARLAQKNGLSAKIVFACLVRDIAIAGFIRGDHGLHEADDHVADAVSVAP